MSEDTIRELHRRVVARSEPGIAGVYSTLPRRFAGSAVVFPNPAKIPALMQDFGAWMQDAAPTPATAFEARFRLTAIHPFGDGSGRTARLLMNLLLIRGGFPPVAVRPDDRKRYLDSRERASLADDLLPYQTFLFERLDSTLSEYLTAAQEVLSPPPPP